MRKFLTFFLFIALVYFLLPASTSAAVISKSLSAPPSLNSGLVGWWTMDGSETSATTVTDKSGSGNNGTRTGGTKVTTGRIGQAMKFSGATGYLTFSNLTLTDNFTISYWSKTNTYTNNSGSTGPMIFGGANASEGYIWEKDSTTIQVSNNGETKYLSPTYQGAADFGWKHITVVASAAKVGVYKNGVFVSETQFASPFTITASKIGQSYNLATYFMNGSIDDFRIYSRALSATEVQQLYKLGGGKINKTDTTRPTLKNGLVGHWTMDGRDVTSTAAIDKSGNGNNGVRTGGTKETTGRIGQAMKFDGTSGRINDPSPPTVATNNWTMSAWMNPANLSQIGLAVSNGLDNGATGNGYAFGVGDGAGGAGSKLQGLFPGVAWFDPGYTFPRANAWYHVVMQRVSGVTKFYVNGIQTANTSATTPLTPTDFNIGSQTGVRYFNGSLDDVRIYSRALSASEIQQLYKQGGGKINKTDTTRPTLKTGLVGHWTMDGMDVTSTVAIDKSGNGNNGTSTLIRVSTGKIGQAAQFNGTSNYIGVASNASLNLTGNMSASVWWKTPRTFSNSYTFVAKYDGAIQPYNYFYDSAQDKMGFYASDGDPATYCSVANLKVNTWYNLVWSYSGSTITCYVNGSPRGTASFTTARSGNSASLTIGQTANTNWVNGLLDDIRVYSRALSATEVMQLYRMGR
ncbi:MAG: LamG domain-containing protein [Patescibacteria group bacterium]